MKTFVVVVDEAFYFLSKAAYSSWQKPPVPVNSWAVFHELHARTLPRVAQWSWGQESPQNVPFDWSIWPCVLYGCHVGTFKYVPSAAWLMSQNLPENLPKFGWVHPSPKYQQYTFVLYSRNGFPFIIGFVDRSANVTFMVLAKMLDFGLIFEVCLSAVLRTIGEIL